MNMVNMNTSAEAIPNLKTATAIEITERLKAINDRYMNTCALRAKLMVFPLIGSG